MLFLQCELFVLFFIICVNSQNTYSIPPQKLIVTKKGFRVSIPDEPEIETFFFHGNINKKVDFLDPNVVILSANKPINGEWLLEYKKEGFKTGDFISYWVHIRRNGETYLSRSIRYQVKEVLPDYPSSSNRPRYTPTSSTTSGYLSEDEIRKIFEYTDNNRLLTKSPNYSTLSPNEINEIFGTPTKSDENTVRTSTSTSTSTISYQWVWPDD
ncbi:hypothetical protein ILUMI_25637 [Ignelater luminosus]|uniref:CBM39 domain-containing protein n=1 Tax=Ignelater luminosus TaxID=2038154 RepID=A0A8K0C595_IGNLU|nr:hypothetical protein ILUMI_25637 [Ignelater luminosus]